MCTLGLADQWGPVRKFARKAYDRLGLHGKVSLPQSVNWSKTKAFTTIRSTGEGVSINLAGREPDGIVDPADFEKVRDQVMDALSSSVDPKTGRRLVKAIYRREEIFKGKHADTAPGILMESAETSVSGSPEERCHTGVLRSRTRWMPPSGPRSDSSLPPRSGHCSTSARGWMPWLLAWMRGWTPGSRGSTRGSRGSMRISPGSMRVSTRSSLGSMASRRGSTRTWINTQADAFRRRRGRRDGTGSSMELALLRLVAR